MKVSTLKQFSVFMPNRPGALSSLAKLFADKDINLIGIASEVRDDSGLVRVAVSSDADVSAILSQGGFSSVETTLLSIELDDKPGELLRLTRILAEAKVNITTVYGTSIDGKSCRILVAVENASRALALIEKAVAGLHPRG
jgi:hypothetical protein